MALSDYLPFLPASDSGYVTPEGESVFGIMAEFETTPQAYKACEHVRDAGYTKWDLHTPFPIHGIEDAMGMKSTILPRIAAIGAFAGVGIALVGQYWITAIDFPFVVQGKDYWAWQPLVPITFELGVLLCAFTSLFGMLALNGLPRWHHPLFKKDRFLDVSDDRFVICIEATDKNFDPAKTKALLEEAGGKHIDLVEA